MKASNQQKQKTKSGKDTMAKKPTKDKKLFMGFLVFLGEP